jgi:hypothetical protein
MTLAKMVEGQVVCCVCGHTGFCVPPSVSLCEIPKGVWDIPKMENSDAKLGKSPTMPNRVSPCRGGLLRGKKRLRKNCHRLALGRVE